MGLFPDPVGWAARQWGQLFMVDGWHDVERANAYGRFPLRLLREQPHGLTACQRIDGDHFARQYDRGCDFSAQTDYKVI